MGEATSGGGRYSMLALFVFGNVRRGRTVVRLDFKGRLEQAWLRVKNGELHGGASISRDTVGGTHEAHSTRSTRTLGKHCWSCPGGEGEFFRLRCVR